MSTLRQFPMVSKTTKQTSLKMAFQPPTARQEMQNRKILEELQQKKQLLLKQGQVSASPTSLPAATGAAAGDAHALTTSQRTALQHAHSSSIGYFIPQDSSFGNLILPVLPRFEK
ncbi:SOSS complex subunit C-like isoform X1 [Ornithodoros turicata]|uniref:SOSS complex subunit C-like isoform X1 n=1 Tax=Ornithodoros turicata TaxID=34597 RepID=UPI00313A3AA9